MNSNERVIEVLNWYDDQSINNVINKEEELMFDVDVDLSMLPARDVCMAAAKTVVPTNKQQYVVTGVGVGLGAAAVVAGYSYLAPVTVGAALVHNTLYNQKGEYNELYNRTCETSYSAGQSMGRRVKALFNR